MTKGKSRKGPQFINYMGPTVEALKELGGSGRPAEVINWIADALEVTDGPSMVIVKVDYSENVKLTQRLGKLLRGQRDAWLICSKVGEEFDNGSSHFDFSPQHTRHSVQRSLQRLGTDHIDIVLVHQLCVRWLNMTESKLHYRALQEEQKKQLQVFKRQGKGFS